MTLFFGASLPLCWQLHVWTLFCFVSFLWPMQEFCESPKKKEFCNYKSLQWSLKIAISSLQSFFYFNNWEILLNIRDIFSNKNPPLISFNNYCIFLFSCTEIVAWVSTKTRCRMMNVILFFFFVCVQDFIAKCIQKDPKKRPQARELLFHEILFEVHSLVLLAAHAIVHSCKYIYWYIHWCWYL